MTSIKDSGIMQSSRPSKLQSIINHLSDKSLYAFNLCLELLATPEDTLNFSFEAYGEGKHSRKRAILHHKFSHHTLTVEAGASELFVDQDGNYWNVPFSVAADLASVANDSGTSYHFCINHVSGLPLRIGDESTSESPTASFPALCAKIAVSMKKNIDIWRSEGPKLKMVLPYDIFLSNPHISASALVGSVIAGSLGNGSRRTKEDTFFFNTRGANSSISADFFASLVLSAQYGNFQRPFLDLTRFNIRVDFPSGSKFLSCAARMAYNLHNSKVVGLEAFGAVCPKTTLSLQQQIAGPFSLRLDSGVELDLQNPKSCPRFTNPVIAIEYALQVLGSAKAVAWYSPKQREFMMELRFFET